MEEELGRAVFGKEEVEGGGGKRGTLRAGKRGWGRWEERGRGSKGP